MGQLQDAGNTTTVAHYLDILGKAGVLCGLSKYSPNVLQQRRSSPRFMAYDTSLITATANRPKDLLLQDSALRGHLIESAIGAYLLARAPEEGFSVQWWRDGQDEVDFVCSDQSKTVAIEVKSGTTKSQGGMAAFLKRYPNAIRLVVGGSAAGSVTVEDFLSGRCDLIW